MAYNVLFEKNTAVNYMQKNTYISPLIYSGILCFVFCRNNITPLSVKVNLDDGNTNYKLPILNNVVFSRTSIITQEFLGLIYKI